MLPPKSQRGSGMAEPVSHDQNFKNLIVDYPEQSLAFLAPDEAPKAEDAVRIVPVREEQLKSDLTERYRRLDVPLLVEWKDGRREAILFAVEEETDPRRFLAAPAHPLLRRPRRDVQNPAGGARGGVPAPWCYARPAGARNGAAGLPVV